MDRLRLVGVQQSLIGTQQRRRALDRSQGGDQLPLDRPTGYGEVLDRPLGLRAPLRVLGHPHLTHRVLLDAELLIAHAPDRRVYRDERLREEPAGRGAARAEGAEWPEASAPRGRYPRDTSGGLNRR